MFRNQTSQAVLNVLESLKSTWKRPDLFESFVIDCAVLDVFDSLKVNQSIQIDSLESLIQELDYTSYTLHGLTKEWLVESFIQESDYTVFSS